jgi:hypothetical protein
MRNSGGWALCVAGGFNLVAFFYGLRHGFDAFSVLSFANSFGQLAAGLSLLSLGLRREWATWEILVAVASNLATIALSGTLPPVRFLAPNLVEMLALVVLALAFRGGGVQVRQARAGFSALLVAYAWYVVSVGGSAPPWITIGNAVVAIAAAVAAWRTQPEAPEAASGEAVEHA